jgi:bifunctional enzyme CysN/CysC
MTIKSTHVATVAHRVAREERWRRNGHLGGVVWFTGLSGSGKTTLAFELEQRLFERGRQAYVLDGDNIRHGLGADLGFTPADRRENIRRVGEVAALIADAGLIALSAFISPYRADRARARQAAGGRFHEVYLTAGLEVCERRDPKGLYRLARQGIISDFTGISAPYEPPERPELAIDTEALTVERSMHALLAYVERVFALGEPSAERR